LHPSSFVDAQNGSRRHITKSQRAAVAVITHCYIRPNHPKNKQVPGTYLSTVAALAEEAGVGDKTIKDAIAADKAGLIDDVRTGNMSAKAASCGLTGSRQSQHGQRRLYGREIRRVRSHRHRNGPSRGICSHKHAHLRINAKCVGILCVGRGSDQQHEGHADIER